MRVADTLNTRKKSPPPHGPHTHHTLGRETWSICSKVWNGVQLVGLGKGKKDMLSTEAPPFPTPDFHVIHLSYHHLLVVCLCASDPSLSIAHLSLLNVFVNPTFRGSMLWQIMSYKEFTIHRQERCGTWNYWPRRGRQRTSNDIHSDNMKRIWIAVAELAERGFACIVGSDLYLGVRRRNSDNVVQNYGRNTTRKHKFIFMCFFKSWLVHAL